MKQTRENKGGKRRAKILPFSGRAGALLRLAGRSDRVGAQVCSRWPGVASSIRLDSYGAEGNPFGSGKITAIEL
jgi:hypothetical protein